MLINSDDIAIKPYKVEYFLYTLIIVYITGRLAYNNYKLSLHTGSFLITAHVWKCQIESICCGNRFKNVFNLKSIVMFKKILILKTVVKLLFKHVLKHFLITYLQFIRFKC